MIVGFSGFGLEPTPTCHGSEVWDASIGACNCPRGTVTTGIVGQCRAPGSLAMTKVSAPGGTTVPLWMVLGAGALVLGAIYYKTKR